MAKLTSGATNYVHAMLGASGLTQEGEAITSLQSSRAQVFTTCFYKHACQNE